MSAVHILKMANQFNPLYKSLIASPILLPLACVLNFLTFIMSSNKVEWEKWSTLELMRRMVVLALDFVVWVTQFLREHLPTSQVLSVKIGEESAIRNVSQASDSAMGRALCQVFALVNDTPVSSEKYEFARTLGDKIIIQNMAQGDATLWETNKVALQAAFSRTLDLLTLALEELQQQQEVKGGSWSWSLLHSVFFRGIATSPHTVFFENMRMCISNFLFPVANSTRFSSELSSSTSVSSGGRASMSGEVAEKLAQELLWVTEKLKECSFIDEAARTWSALSRLAKLSLSAHPRVQASLLRVCVLFLKELTSCESDSLKVNLLLLWLPLFCHAKSGFDCPSSTPSEKGGILRVLEQTILSFSVFDQETVLACWLREYVSTSSEWPNLQQCFESWCHSIRKSTTISPY